MSKYCLVKCPNISADNWHDQTVHTFSCDHWLDHELISHAWIVKFKYNVIERQLLFYCRYGGYVSLTTELTQCPAH